MTKTSWASLVAVAATTLACAMGGCSSNDTTNNTTNNGNDAGPGKDAAPAADTGPQPEASTGKTAEEYITQRQCRGCHGDDLSGNDKGLQKFPSAFPPNLTPDKDTGLGDWSDEQVAKAILDGIDDEGATLCVMPHFRTFGMTDDEANAIVKYLRALKPVSHATKETDCAGSDGGTDGGDGGTTDAGDAGDAGHD